MKSFFLKHQKKSAPGFTLVEFIVILSIFALMAAVALFNFQGFRSNVGLNNLAHDIALTIRQSQVFGWSTLTDKVPLGDPDNPIRIIQGTHFGVKNGEYEREFILYEKSFDQGNGAFVAGDTIIDTIKIQGPNHISDIRTASDKAMLAIDPVTHQLSSGSSVSLGAQEFSVAFSRPRPEAIFFAGGNQLVDPDSNFIGIYISSDGDAPNVYRHVITISRFGEIDVQ